MELVDLHLHSHFSRDGRGSIEDFCEEAVARGFSHLCFTEHVEYHKQESRMELFLDLDTYFHEVELMRDKYDGLSICIGLEVGDPHFYGEEFRAFVEAHDFDLIIAAAHMFDGYFIGDERYLKSKEISSLFLEYFEAIDRILEYPFFDIIGHIDFPKRFLQGEKAYPLDGLEDLLKRIIALEKGIEINTSALRKGQVEPCPGEEILSLYRRSGGDVVTLGSDAHDPDDLGSGIEEAIELLKKTGFRGYYVFEKRRRIFKPFE